MLGHDLLCLLRQSSVIEIYSRIDGSGDFEMFYRSDRYLYLKIAYSCEDFVRFLGPNNSTRTIKIVLKENKVEKIEENREI